MVRNIILDVGMVLVDFCWRELMESLGFDGETLEAVADATVRTPQWNEYDRSSETDEELLETFLQTTPGRQAQIRLFWEHMEGMIRQYPYAKPWIRAMKAAGYRVYILSNYARRTYALTRESGLDFLPLTDGAVFSFETGHIKPEPEIYHVVMDKYHLTPSECVFLDDNAANLTYPKQIGWNTIRFLTLEQANAELETLGVMVDPVKTAKK